MDRDLKSRMGYSRGNQNLNANSYYVDQYGRAVEYNSELNENDYNTLDI
jgi:hypothetical protein